MRGKYEPILNSLIHAKKVGGQNGTQVFNIFTARYNLIKENFMATWEEIKTLAADLRRVQLGGNEKRLSKRNCIELISKLIESGLIDLVTTSDGKEYITHDYLVTLIKNEIIANGGRVSLSDIHLALGVQYQQIEDHADLLLKSDDDITICLGQLITKEYLKNLCREVDSLLQNEGRVSISNLSKRYELPVDFLKNEIHQQIPLIVHAIIDPADPCVLYTESFVNTQAAIIRGALCGITR
ncbi:unnamed protein product [Soboliphyme baturini]|uniref:E3 UFM1-protein ligase 1 homolog n=1 Tax=Soboliphyme baturini TaxID=241478 RepID=A0A183ILF9_9BILA|nr:unnamed protein product [Soboliphyme baturini]